MTDLERYNELRWETVREMEFAEKLDMIEPDLKNSETIIGYALQNAIKDYDVPNDAEVIDKLDYLTNDQFNELKEAIDDYIYSFKKVRIN